MSWEDIKHIAAEPTEAEREAAAKDRNEVVDAFTKLFGTTRGKQVYAYLYERTIGRPTFIQPGAGVDGKLLQKFQDMREGENNMVRLIASICKQGGLEL